MSNPGSKYVRLLADTKGQRLNNGTVAGGLAHALTQGMRGYAARKADEEEKQKAEQREQAMADTLAAMNGPALTSEGPTQDAASRARFEAPGRIAQMLNDPQTRDFGMMVVNRGLAPPPERKTMADVNGISRYIDTGEQVFSGVEKAQSAPAGWQRNQDGSMAPIPGGPADPGYLASIRPEKEPTPSGLTKLIGEYNSLAPDDPNRALYQQMLGKMTTPTGTSLTVAPDGTISFSQGAAKGPDLARPTMNKVEADLLNASAAMQRITNIRNSFDPSFLTYGTQFDNWLTAVQDKTVGGISPEARERLGAYTTYALDTKENLNKTIQELTGAAMGADEAVRIKATVPNEQDSPEEFSVKLDRTTEKMRHVIARLNYIRANGLKWEDVPLDDMRGIMGQRATDLIKELRVPGVSDEDLTAKVQMRLRDEFGLTGAQ